MPTSGLYTVLAKVYWFADKSFVANTFRASKYKSISEDLVGSGKFFSAVNGIGDEDVRLSKRRNLSTKRLRGFERNKVGPVDGVWPYWWKLCCSR